ncbi:hypothetical protein ACGFW5_21030 [Streptomyces sp. NPDC048416]|uniref:hypothetical protein n=1 Tax=Streptomyces sp. NPDC048416 TaxID=3365546 RepID=UPI0037156997
MDRRGALVDSRAGFATRHGLEVEEQTYVLSIVAEQAYPSTLGRVRTGTDCAWSTAEL